ncbi:MAG: phenylacetate--CoA ligase family protein [Deltaproteobacteria bacterium]|nr:phenylacetate--CoA ligase family protein [Deltaproteobacteria bacterium]
MSNLDPEERKQLQLERLQSTLNRAFRNVPFHRNRLQEKGLEPSCIESVDDLALLPFMERKHLGEHYPYGLFAVPLRDIVRIHSAPGTTSNPTVSGYTRQDMLFWRQMTANALEISGVTSQDILQINLDFGLANWGRDYKDSAEIIGAGVIPSTTLSLDKQLMVLRDYKTSVLITTPSMASELADHMLKSEVNPAELSLTTLILVGEHVDHSFRELLEKQLHVKTWLHYGLSEVPGPAIAFECSEHVGLHVNEEYFLAEIIDPQNGRVVGAGRAGELVLTTLTTRAFPLIRFRTGDRARFAREICPCGQSLSRIEWLARRTDDMLNIRGVKVHQQQILFQIERALGFVPDHYHISKKQQGLKNLLEVWIAVDDTLFSDEIKALESVVKRVGSILHENLGVPVTIRLKEKDSFRRK